MMKSALYSIEDGYSGGNPASYQGSDYFETTFNSQNAQRVDTIFRTYVLVNVDESIYTNESLIYRLRFNSQEPLISCPSPANEYVFHTSTEGCFTEYYCRSSDFLGSEDNPIREYEMCYTVEY